MNATPVRILVLLLTTTALAACTSDSGNPPADSSSSTTASKVIGPKGGTLLGPDGSQVLVPEAALASAVTLSITKVDSGYPGLPEGRGLVGSVFSFEPHGQQFGREVTVRLPYPVSAALPLEVVSAEPGGSWTVARPATNNAGSIEVGTDARVRDGRIEQTQVLAVAVGHRHDLHTDGHELSASVLSAPTALRADRERDLIARPTFVVTLPALSFEPSCLPVDSLVQRRRLLLQGVVTTGKRLGPAKLLGCLRHSS
jgi:ZU5 domain